MKKGTNYTNLSKNMLFFMEYLEKGQFLDLF